MFFFTFEEYKSKPDYAMKYFTKDSPHYILNDFLYDEYSFEQRNARRRFFEVVLLFEDNIEKDTFMGYVHLHKDIFLDKLNSLEGGYSWIEASNNLERKEIVIRLHTGKVLNQMLLEFRDCNR